MTVPSLRGSTRHEHSVSVARLGMALSPANSAIPSSRISGMTYDMALAADAPELERQERPEGAVRRDRP